MRWVAPVVVLVVTALAFAACKTEARADAGEPAPKPKSAADAGTAATSSASDMPAQAAAVVVETPAGPVRYTVELAITGPERNKGLMYREHMEDDAGMLFLFEKQGPQSFWMKNTRIPLDMIFIDEAGVIAGIVESAEPMTLTSRKVDKPSRYVLEINGGAARARGIAAGQRVRFEGVPPKLVDARVLQ